MCYPGSTELRTKKELDDYDKNGKGYTLVTIDDEKDDIDVQHVNLPLKRKYIIKEIKYPKLEETLVEINDEIKDLEVKPILDLTVKEGDFEKSDVLEKIDEIIGDKALSIRCICNPTIIDDGEIEEWDNLTPEKALENRIIKDYGENEGIIHLTTSLYHELSIPNEEEALHIADDYFEKNYRGE